jgi:cytoskeletal protein RodZ
MQEYCIECGLRLPLDRGIVPAVGRAWRLQVSRYPGGWLWVVLVLLGLTVFATVAAILASDEGESAVRTIVATEPTPTARPTATVTAFEPTTATTTSAPATAETTPTTSAGRPSAPVEWPAGKRGHTVVVASVPTTTGRDRALRLARVAIQAGLPGVGVLDSSEFASLRPGYYVVFSGVYDTVDGALAAVETAQARGYPRAYEREITP